MNCFQKQPFMKVPCKKPFLHCPMGHYSGLPWLGVPKLQLFNSQINAISFGLPINYFFFLVSRSNLWQVPNLKRGKVSWNLGLQLGQFGVKNNDHWVLRKPKVGNFFIVNPLQETKTQATPTGRNLSWVLKAHKLENQKNEGSFSP